MNDFFLRLFGREGFNYVDLKKDLWKGDVEFGEKFVVGGFEIDMGLFFVEVDKIKSEMEKIK